MSFDWKTLIPVFETAGNIAELAIPGGAAFAPLTQAVENALNPILQKIGTGQSEDIQTEVMACYGTAISALHLAKTKANIDPALLAKINEYLNATIAAMNGYFAAGKGFDPAEFVPVTPIVIPPAQ